MRASKIGIEVNKAELTALLTFAGSGEEDWIYFGVRSPRAKLVASATDGKRALEITTESDSDDHVIGEWQIARAFLEACGRVVESEGLCVLLVTPTGLRKARVMDVESHAERATVSWHEEAASTQVSMATLSGIIQNAKLLAGHRGSWFALQGRYLADMNVVSRACDKAPITIYPPAGPIDPMYFEATSDGAQWRGCIMPVTVEQPGGRADDEEQPDDMASSRSVREAADQFRDTLDKHGMKLKVHVGTGADDGVVDNDYKPDGHKPPKKPRKTKSKGA